VPAVLLVEPADAARLRDREQLTDIAVFASGIGPGKSIVADHPGIVGWAHEAGLRVTPWTFRAETTRPFETVGAEMNHYLVELGVDAVITDHPDACPRAGLCPSCAYGRQIESSRGSTFYLCERSATDPGFPKYPRLPVIQCTGYATRASR
jgi:hypothetical protein